MKKCKMSIPAAIILLIFTVIQGNEKKLYAGTINGGGKFLYAEWDSAVSQLFEDVLDDIVENDIQPLVGIPLYYSASYEQGSGYMAGAILGYETEDGKWLFDAEFLLLNSFEQDASVSARAGSIPVKTRVNIEMDRKEININACYFFNKYFNAFLGYKYETYNLKAEVNLALLSSIIPEELLKYEYGSNLHLVLPGIGGTLPFGNDEQYKLGINMGTLAGRPKLKDKIRGEHIEIKGKFGLIVEIYGSVKLAEHFNIRTAYGYETYTAEISMKDRNIKKDVSETFKGFNLEAVYIF